MTQTPPPFSMTRWLLTSLRRFVVRSIVVIGGLQAFNYLFGGDDDWKAWASANRAEIAIGLLVCAVANLMYDWLRSHEP